MFTHLEEFHSGHIQRFEEQIQQCENNEIICLICDQRVKTKTKAYEHINKDHPSYLPNWKMEATAREIEDPFEIKCPKLSEGQEMATNILNTISMNENKTFPDMQRKKIPMISKKKRCPTNFHHKHKYPTRGNMH